MESTTKRNQSRCREWERQRRNKFNDAIVKLGEVVKTITEAKDPSGNDTENVQYPKIEVIQKAILCLTNCAQEQTQLRAEILALQVKIDAYEVQKMKKDASAQVYIGVNKKDASTQVFIGVKKSGKYVKLRMLQKSQHNTLKEKSLVTNVTVESEVQNTKPLHKELKILPKINLTEKNGPGNTIVVLPATPYIIPQRPLLFPSIPPALVLVSPNMQTLNKQSIPIFSRNSGDSTKTTMVNILPIAAYSCPLSESKNKKYNAKVKYNSKKAKKSKPTSKVSKDLIIKNNEIPNVQINGTVKENKNSDGLNDESNKNRQSLGSKINSEPVQVSISKSTSTIDNSVNTLRNENTKKINNNDTSYIHKTQDPKSDKVTISMDQAKCTESIIGEVTTSVPTMTTIVKSVSTTVNSAVKEEPRKISLEKENVPEDREKGNKLPNILETTLCDATVDGGNARLELAEEFLAASPTAAFLMSFPLVSGNRADSPPEETQNTVQANSKDNNQRRNELTPQTGPYFDKSSNSVIKIKSTNKLDTPSVMPNKQNEQQKYINSSKEVQSKTSNTVASSNTSNENPFLNLPIPSLLSTACTLSDTTFGLDFDCNISKPMQNQPTSFVSNSNIFYKSDPFSTVKNTIYSTSSITSNHDFNSLGLYPCAMDKYSSKNKSDFNSVEDNLMKMGPSRLTYDIDLGWSHKGFDFVNCTTTSSTFSKDILTTVSAPYSTSYNPFNPEFHVPLVSNSNKKENVSIKPTSFAETISNFYSQPTNLWTEDVPFYTNNNASKNLTNKHQSYSLDLVQPNFHLKNNDVKPYEAKQIVEVRGSGMKPTMMSGGQQMSEKYTKKSPSKTHINWMTSEIRPMQNNCNPVHAATKEIQKSTFNQSDHKTSYNQQENVAKKQDHNESNNYFPITMHNFPAQTAQEEFQIWPSARPLGTTEISIDPPPINLPTLVGDLALGPHDKKKNAEATHRVLPQTDIQNCGNFLSVTQLMNRSTDNMHSRYQGSNIETPKPVQTKDNITHFTNESNRKAVAVRAENHPPQPCYVYNNAKLLNSYENSMHQFSQTKSKTNNKSEKSSKNQKNSYSAEALIRGGSCSQKVQDSNSAKFMVPLQKYNEFNTPQDSSVAQVSHFPPILDYSENSYASQQFAGTTLYNSTTNTISNSFYSNFMPGSSNLMSGNYASGPFTGDFTDYNQTTECNYSNHKYEDVKMRNNSAIFQQDKAPSNYKTSRRESAAKHKLECSKKDSTKKYQSKRTKLNPEVEEWNDTSHLLWQNKTSSKRHSNLTSEELTFPNYVGNQMATQYQPDFFNSHLMPSNGQSVGHNIDRSLSTFPVTSRANFNLSTIFPEITMKVQ